MKIFEENELNHFTPCYFKSLVKIIEAISIVHTELILVHPFREGNGRIARLLVSLMALQAGIPALDFKDIRGKRREEYFEAVRIGINHDYRPMIKVFETVIKHTLKKYNLD